MKDYCGVFGIYSFDGAEVAISVYYGLFSLQHRGQESAGIASLDGKDIRSHKGMGLVNQVFDDKSLRQLKGRAAIGHVRYSTTGSSIIENAQPIVVDTRYGQIALAHNGNLINTDDLRQELKDSGMSFMGTTDSEVMAALIAASNEATLENALLNTFKKCKGAFSIVILAANKIIAVRDPNGIRPLSIGKLDKGYVISSETCAMDLLGATNIRDVLNGEMVVIDNEGMRSRTWTISDREAMCVFEYIYFARPDSILHGHNVYEARFQMGKYLAKEKPVEADIVIAVPESGVPAAIGYAAESKITYGEGMIKNRYIGRTFIEPTQEIRDLGVKLKLNPIKDAVRGKKVIVVDDSIVRGTTSRQILRLIRDAGAREVHMRVSSPPILYPCFYGVDMPTRAELIAANLSIEGVRKYIEADTLAYLSLKNLSKAISYPSTGLCQACLNGEYPVKISEKMQSLNLLFK